MAMSKKDYELIAGAFSAAGDAPDCFNHLVEAIDRLTLTFQMDNPRFSPTKFIEACKPTWVPGTRYEKYWDDIIRKYEKVW